MQESTNRALFLVGGPGSGKDYVITNILERFGLHEIQLDQLIQTGIPEDASPLLVNCTGNQSKINHAKSILEGYEFSHIVVSVTNQVSRQRNELREQPLAESARIRKWLDCEKLHETLDNCLQFKNSLNLNKAATFELLIFQEQIANTLKFMIENGYVLSEAKPKKNPVAKNTFAFNKPKVEPDKTKYSRKPKHSRTMTNEDLRKWFDQKWVRMGTDGEIKGDCAREDGEGKPKCLPAAKARAMSKTERAKAARRKRREDPVADRKGKGNKPINVATNEEYLSEKNEPTNPELWSKAKSLAKSKFDVYPSAYANGWAAKWYKSKGGGWKSVSEAYEEGTDEAREAYMKATPFSTIDPNPTLKPKKQRPKKGSITSDFDARFGGAEYMTGGSPFVQAEGFKKFVSLKEATLSEALEYHLERKIPITETVFRPGTDKFFQLIVAAKELYSEGVYTPSDEYEASLLESDIGEYGYYRGEKVPLDYPFLEEEESSDPTKGHGIGNPWKEGGGGAVYVKTGDGVRKIRFSQSGMTKKYNDPARVKSFIARHNCLSNNDKTSASYWACRWPRYFSKSGQRWW